ncbi:MAG: prenyltransferase, partial [Candidatus Thermoplasmatota archaeon]
FLRVSLNLYFSDIKDIETDKKEGLITIVMLFSNRQKALNFLHFFNFISLIPLFWGVFFGIFPKFSLFLVFSSFLSFYYIQKAKNIQIDILSLTSIFADSELYYWPFFVFIGMILIV